MILLFGLCVNTLILVVLFSELCISPNLHENMRLNNKLTVLQFYVRKA